MPHHKSNIKLNYSVLFGILFLIGAYSTVTWLTAPTEGGIRDACFGRELSINKTNHRIMEIFAEHRVIDVNSLTKMTDNMLDSSRSKTSADLVQIVRFKASVDQCVIESMATLNARENN